MARFESWDARTKPETNMLPTTVDLIRCALKSDPTLTPADRARLLGVMRQSSSPPPIKPVDALPRIITRKRLAELCDKSLRWVDKLDKSGLLKKFHLPGCQRAAGFLESDVRWFLQIKSEASVS